MKKHKLSKHIIISIVISTLLLVNTVLQKTSILSQIISAIYGFRHESGSDGPTTVFLSSSYKYLSVLSFIDLLGIIYILIILILCYRTFIKEK